MKKLIVIVLSLFTLSGCMPWIMRKTPAVHGSLVANGSPVANADIYLIAGFSQAQCRESPISAHSVTDGSFSIKGSKGIGAIGYGDYVNGFTLCIHNNNRWYFGYHEGGMGYSPPSQLILHCDISTPSPEETASCRQ